MKPDSPTTSPSATPEPTLAERLRAIGRGIDAADDEPLGKDRATVNAAADALDAAALLARLAWTFKAYPQGLAGQDPLCGVTREDVHRLRDLAAAYEEKSRG